MFFANGVVLSTEGESVLFILQPRTNLASLAPRSIKSGETNTEMPAKDFISLKVVMNQNQVISKSVWVRVNRLVLVINNLELESYVGLSAYVTPKCCVSGKPQTHLLTCASPG